MIYASVCSGVEAASLAWIPLGWKAAWFSEIEPFPCAVLKHRFPEVPNLGDMTKIKVETIENETGKLQRFKNESGADVVVPGGVDLLVGGTPCQSFSFAGNRSGLRGVSGLALTYCELLETMRPRWFVWENVPGVFSANQGDDFRTFLRKIDEIGYSVDGECWTLSTSEWTDTLVPFRKEDDVSSLSDILVPISAVPQEYYLSRKACSGLLRRAEARGRALPDALQQVLVVQAGKNSSIPSSAETEDR